MLRIKGVEAPPVVVEPDYVSLKIDYKDESGTTLHSTDTRLVKGETIELQFAPTDWEVATLMRYNGNGAGGDVKGLMKGGTYTSSALEFDTRFEVTLKYAREVVFTDEAGVATLPVSSVRVSGREGDILIEGLAGDETVTVYTLSGLTAGTRQATPGMDVMRISLEPGTYIVRVKGPAADEAAKIRL